MKIAIHPWTGSFSDRWISYCKENQIDFKIVNCYKSNIIEQLLECDGLMWHWAHDDHKAILFARQLILSLERHGIKVFPNSNTCWHFDDKIGQKYLSESLDIPLVPTYVFYDFNEALQWAKNSKFPKVFKLRGGAGSRNVKLVMDFNQARKYIRKSFSKGFLLSDPFVELKDRYSKMKSSFDFKSLIKFFKGIIRLIVPTEFQKQNLREKGYVYFQDFIPDNEFDIRIVVIGEKAVALRRRVRKNDFRASGSGYLSYDIENLDSKIIEYSFASSEKIGSQCMAYDFVFDKSSNPLIVEMSYAFSMKAYDYCKGFWDRNLVWHKSETNLPYFMIEDFLKQIKNR